MENKQDVVEKRIKPGVIRRRAQAPKAAPELSEEAKEEKLEAVSEAEVLQEEKAQPAEAPIPELPVVETEIQVGAPALDTEKPAEVREPSTPSAPEVAEKPKVSTATKSSIQGPRDLPEGPPVGTIIQLPHMKRAEAAKTLNVSGRPEGAAPTVEDDRFGKLKKTAKRGKGEGDNLEIEGFGRVNTISQLARLSNRSIADRVFQPVRSAKRRKGGKVKGGKITTVAPKASKRVIRIQDSIVLSDLAQQLGVRSSELIKKLMDLGTTVAINQSIDFETASLLAQDYQWEVKNVGFEEETVLTQNPDTPEDLESRAPVVTVMGHVDHGKTSLLDAIRSSQVASGEAGGITQHIGSYKISLGPGRDITFLDTPGHEAFTAMRARGASVTDIVILVVAADDGVMPQTIEAINHAKAAEVPIIVAVNKIDKPEANPDNVKRQLAEHGLQSEDWGGDTLFAHVSAKQKQGLDGLLDLVFLQAEMLNLQVNRKKPARGVIIEARLDKSRGPVATVLIQEGTLKLGDTAVAGLSFCKVKAMINDLGAQIAEAGPGTPVEVLGLDNVPKASDIFQVVADDKGARQVLEHRSTKFKEEKNSASGKMSLEDLFGKMQSGEVKELGLIVKADVQGSVEALQGSLDKLPADKVKIRVLHAAVGGITESDVMLAEASNGIIIGFNVRPDTKAQKLSEREGVEIKVYKVIYDVIDDVRKAMEGLLEPTLVEKYLGRAEVKQAFNVSKIGVIAGCVVVDGKILASAKVRLLRDNVIIHDGKLTSLKRFKDDAREVLHGQECGMGIENYNDIKAGDVIECYQVDVIKGKLA